MTAVCSVEGDTSVHRRRRGEGAVEHHLAGQRWSDTELNVTGALTVEGETNLLGIGDHRR